MRLCTLRNEQLAAFVACESVLRNIVDTYRGLPTGIKEEACCTVK